MTDRPVIFSAPMIAALLAGRKTQTRRKAWSGIATRADGIVTGLRPSPWQRVQPGDRLWVREAFGYWWRGDVRGEPGRPPDSVIYRADEEHSNKVGWAPSIHMPRWASRLTLTVTEVRRKRLQDISEEDARAEGVERDTEPCDHARRTCAEIGCLGPTYKSSFCGLWCDLHGAEAWRANPEVVVLSFRCERRNIDAPAEAAAG